MPDNDGQALVKYGNALGELQYKYRKLGPVDREEMRPQLEEAFERYQALRILLLAPGDLFTEADLALMTQISDEVQRAADKQSLIAGAIKIVSFARGFII